MKLVSVFVLSLLASTPAQAGDLGNYILRAYVMASVDRKFIKGCDRPESCPVPANAHLVECTLVSGRFGFQDSENEGEMVCILEAPSKPRAEIKKIFLDLHAGAVELTDAKVKFQKFQDWSSVKAGIEAVRVVEIPLSQNGTIKVEKLAALKNLVWEGGIQNGITLNVYFTDVLIRGDEAFRNVLKVHCGRRAKHLRQAFGTLEAKVAEKLEPFLTALDNGCQFK